MHTYSSALCAPQKNHYPGFDSASTLFLLAMLSSSSIQLQEQWEKYCDISIFSLKKQSREVTTVLTLEVNMSEQCGVLIQFFHIHEKQAPFLWSQSALLQIAHLFSPRNLCFSSFLGLWSSPITPMSPLHTQSNENIFTLPLIVIILYHKLLKSKPCFYFRLLTHILLQSPSRGQTT